MDFILFLSIENKKRIFKRDQMKKLLFINNKCIILHIRKINIYKIIYIIHIYIYVYKQKKNSDRGKTVGPASCHHVRV